MCWRGFAARRASRSCAARREQINQNLCYRWTKEILETGKKRLAGDTKREAKSDEVQALRTLAVQLKELLVEMMLDVARQSG